MTYYGFFRSKEGRPWTGPLVQADTFATTLEGARRLLQKEFTGPVAVTPLFGATPYARYKVTARGEARGELLISPTLTPEADPPAPPPRSAVPGLRK